MEKVKVLFIGFMLVFCGSAWAESDLVKANKIINSFISGRVKLNSALAELYICSRSGNIECTAGEGALLYKNNRFSDAYPLLVKSQGIRKDVTGINDRAWSDRFLGEMFFSGAGIIQDYDKAIEHYKVCAIAGDKYCAKAVALSYAQKEKLPVTSEKIAPFMAWLMVAQAMGEESIPVNGANVNLRDLLSKYEDDSTIENFKKTKDEAHRICSTIPKCNKQ